MWHPHILGRDAGGTRAAVQGDPSGGHEPATELTARAAAHRHTGYPESCCCCCCCALLLRIGLSTFRSWNVRFHGRNPLPTTIGRGLRQVTLDLQPAVTPSREAMLDALVNSNVASNPEFEQLQAVFVVDAREPAAQAAAAGGAVAAAAAAGAVAAAGRVRPGAALSIGRCAR